MTEPVVPVRAWAEYPEWSVYHNDETGNTYLIPKGWKGDEFSFHSAFFGVVDFVSYFAEVEVYGVGPLQSLRVLLSNGAELMVNRAFQGGNNYWLWSVDDNVVARLPAGSFVENDNDAEAVQRALDEAMRFYAQPALP